MTGAPYSKQFHEMSRNIWSGLAWMTPSAPSLFPSIRMLTLVARCMILYWYFLLLRSSACSGTRAASVRCKHPNTLQAALQLNPLAQLVLHRSKRCHGLRGPECPNCSIHPAIQRSPEGAGRFGRLCPYADANKVRRFPSHWFFHYRMRDLRSESPHSRKKSSTVHCHLRPCSTKLFASTAARAEIIHPSVFGEVNLNSSMFT